MIINRTIATLALLWAVAACGAAQDASEGPERPVDGLAAPQATQTPESTPEPVQRDPGAELRATIQGYFDAVYSGDVKATDDYLGMCNPAKRAEMLRNVSQGPAMFDGSRLVVDTVVVKGQKGWPQDMHFEGEQAEQLNGMLDGSHRPEDVWVQIDNRWELSRCPV